MNCKYRTGTTPRFPGCIVVFWATVAAAAARETAIGGHFSGIEDGKQQTQAEEAYTISSSIIYRLHHRIRPHNREHCAIYPGTPGLSLAHGTRAQHDASRFSPKTRDCEEQSVLFHLVAETRGQVLCFSLFRPSSPVIRRCCRCYNILLGVCVCVRAKRSSATRQPAGVNQVRACVRSFMRVVACCSIAAHHTE